MAQQTAIEWLLENIPQRFSNAFINSCSDIIEQAKQMEKQQIEDAYKNGSIDSYWKDSYWNKSNVSPEQYYKKNYQNK